MDLCVWDLCNNKCLQCTNPDRPWPAWDNTLGYQYEDVIRRLEAYADRIRAEDSLYLSGGEPTLHPRFLDILKYIQRQFPDQTIKLLTNARRFVYDNFAREVMRVNRNFEIDVSLYGPNAEVHDQVTRAAGSFKQTLAGLENLLKHRLPGHAIGIRIVLTQKSYPFIRETLALLQEKYPQLDRVIVIFWEVEAQAIKNMEEVAYTYQDLFPYLEGVSALASGFRELRFYHFPLCGLPSELWPYAWRTLTEAEVAFLEACAHCSYQEYCLGIHKGYLENVETDFFKPIKNEYDIEPSLDKYRPINKATKK